MPNMTIVMQRKPNKHLNAYETQNSIVGPGARLSCFFFCCCQLSALSGIMFSDVECFIVGQKDSPCVPIV